MRRLLLIAFGFCLLMTSLAAQNSSVDIFYNKYKTDEQSPTVEQEKWLCKLAPGISSNAEARKWINDPSKVKIIVLDEGTVEKADLESLRKNVKSEGLDAMIQVRDKEEHFDVFAQADQGLITNVLYLIDDKDEFVFLNLSGGWKLSEILGKCNWAE